MQLSKAKSAKLAASVAQFDSRRSHQGAAAGGGHAQGQGGHSESERRAIYRDREIIVRTHYEILIDGKPLETHVRVLDDGRVHCHSLPNYGFRSAIDLARKMIDAFSRELPEDELAEMGKKAGGYKKPAKKRKKPRRKAAARKSSAKKKTAQKAARKRGAKKAKPRVKRS